MSETILVHFWNAGVSATWLTPTITIKEIGWAIVVNWDNMTEDWLGTYKYIFAGYDKTKKYTINADWGATLSDTDRYPFGTNVLDAYPNKEDWKWQANTFVTINEEDIVKKIVEQLDITKIAKEIKKDLSDIEKKINAKTQSLVETVQNIRDIAKSIPWSIEKSVFDYDLIIKEIKDNKISLDFVDSLSSKIESIKLDVDLQPLIVWLWEIRNDLEEVEDKISTNIAGNAKNIVYSLVKHMESNDDKEDDIYDKIINTAKWFKKKQDEPIRLKRHDWKEFII